MVRKNNKGSASDSNLQTGSIVNRADKKNNEESPFDLSDLLKKKWKVFRASPLFNFNENKLKFIEKKLNVELSYRKNIGSDILYASSLKTNKVLKLKEDEAEAIQVEITTNQNKKFYLGYFISCVQDNKNSGFASSSILLVDSKSSFVYDVHCSLSKIFDCDMYPITFVLNDLITLFVKLLENPEKKADDSEEVITLTYKIPGCKSEDNLDITLVLDDTTIVLALTIDRLRESFPEITTTEIMTEFYSRLLNHIYKIYKVDLMMTQLHGIHFPQAFISAEGLFKASTEDSVGLILNILQKINSLFFISNYNPYGLK